MQGTPADRTLAASRSVRYSFGIEAGALIACGMLFASLLPSPALGATYIHDYRDTRLDPDTALQVDSTTRGVWTSERGRWLKIAIAPFPDLRVARDLSVHIHLDTDGDRTRCRSGVHVRTQAVLSMILPPLRPQAACQHGRSRAVLEARKLWIRRPSSETGITAM